jgi:periplasmic divalent cation tolerance protein
MTDLLLVYVTCKDVAQAKAISLHLMNKKLCACTNIFPDMQPMFFWPPKSGTIDESKDVALIIKTLESKYAQVEAEIQKIHSFDTPCILAIPVAHVGKKYYDWLVGEME